MEATVEAIMRLQCQLYHTVDATMDKLEFPALVEPPPPMVSHTEMVLEWNDASEEKGADVATVAKIPRPRLPVIFYRLMPKSRLKAVAQYIGSFEYCLNPQTNFNSQKQRPLFLIMETAKTIINGPQPIKCVEAVFVALLLTAGLPDVERFPLSFQTVLDDQYIKELYSEVDISKLDLIQVYQHIVLLVHYFGKYGAFGISRWPEFMSKDLKFDSMSSVIENYKTAYEEQHHAVEKIRVGLPVEHNTRSTNFVCWRHLELNLEDQSWPECCAAIDSFAGKAQRLWSLWIRSGRGEDPWQLYVRQTKRLLAGRKASPLKAKRLNSGIVPAQDLTADTFEDSGHLESMEFVDSRNVSCRFNIQPPSSRESARITLSLEPGEVIYPPKPTKDVKKATEPVVQKEFSFNNVTPQPSKFRRSKKVFKVGSAQSEAAATRSVKSIKGAIRSLPRAAQHQNSVEQPPVVSQCLLRTKYLDGTPGFDGPKTCWECLRTVYRTKNEARLLLLKTKLADLRMQGPNVGEAFRVVQDIFQQLVGIGEAITSKLDEFEGTINVLTENFDAVVQSANCQDDLHSLKQLARQLTDELPIATEEKKVVPVVPKRNVVMRKTAHDPDPYRVPPCNWCGLHGHRMRDCEDLEKEIARRVREYKNRIGPTLLPDSPREAETLDLPSGKLVLWHKNRYKTQDQRSTGDSDSQRQNGESADLVAGEDTLSAEVDMHQLTEPSAGSRRPKKKKMSLVQRRFRTKLMYLLGMNKPGPQLNNQGISRRKTPQKKKPCKDLPF